MRKSGLMELEAVVAIARHGSFRAAASDLDTSPTAISNAVASLEKRLGVRLFNRTTRNVALTSAGREYVEAIAPALSDIRSAAQAVADHRRKPTGTLRFSCSLGGGRQVLMPFVIEYRRRYNEMKVEIITEGRLIDIIQDGFDAGVRLAEAVPRDMIAVPLGPHTRHVVVGAPSYFANRSRPLAPGDLMNHESDLIAQASRAGIGLAYIGEWIVADDIAAGRLVEVLSEWTPSYPGYCLYYPGRRHMAASLRAFIDLAQKIVSRNRAKAS